MNREISSTNDQHHLMVMYREFYIVHKYNESMELIRHEYGGQAEAIIDVLAEPSFGAAHDHDIFWHTSAKGEIRPYRSLSSAEREEALKTVRSARGEVESLAEKLIATGDPNKVVQGEILKRIFTWPDNDSSIYMVGARTVLANWGLKPCPPSIPHKGAPAQVKTSRFFTEKSEEKILPSSGGPASRPERTGRGRLPFILIIVVILGMAAAVGFSKLKDFRSAPETGRDGRIEAGEGINQ
ncbi:hypothetical protein C4J81_01735 [Deltaproteobacteria bacterium Smac51]|nr:hypothetical protein C4J81_01735 [Deltaproteobacteria bacterium Smac51]